jgi:Coenzyme PQQ synthesis protein D (PqqD)
VRWRIHPDVVWIGDDDEIRLYHSGRGEFETLNTTAAAIWRLADAGRTLAEIVAELAGAHGAGDDAQRRRIEADVREFVDELAGRGILTPDPAVDDAPAR